LTGLACLLGANIVLPPRAGASQADENRMVSSFEAAMEKGDQATALKHVLEYSERTNGEDAPVTIRLMHRYGYSLYKGRKYREAINVLKETLERSTKVYGEFGGEAYEINMNLANAYSHRRHRWGPRLKYFDRALEVLRERGERESITYVATLVSIVINLLDSDSLSGTYNPDYSDTLLVEEVSDYEISNESEYSSNFNKPEKYLQEAIEVGARLENLDEYISAKIAVLHAKLKVMETAELATVPGGSDGSITKSTERKYYDREEERLTIAIDELARDPVANQTFLDAANNIMLQIAWLDEDEGRLRAMCASGRTNSAGDYPPDRLYEIMEGGIVFAPEIGIRISTNIFKQQRSWRRPTKDENGNPVKKPYFKPVCVDKQLMAALIHAPRVTIEEMR
jgi:tetratricopeptide (TPR) repeat protein